MIFQKMHLLILHFYHVAVKNISYELDLHFLILSKLSKFMDNKKCIIKTLTSRLNALRKVAAIFSFKTQLMIANGIFMSHIVYLIQLWGGCSNYLIDAIQILQNQAARHVTKLSWSTPISELLKQCNWLSVRQMIMFHDLILVFKIRKERRPVYLSNKLSNQFNCNTRNAKNNKIKQNQIPKLPNLALSIGQQ